jgi:hypothetical protein
VTTLALFVIHQAASQLGDADGASYVPLAVDALKWAAQVLLIATGLWALLGAESIRLDPATGRRRLTSNGWTRILLLLVGFALFAATDRQQKREARAKDLLNEKKLEDARTELEYMRRLLRAQNQWSGVRLEWTLDEPVAREVRSRIASGGGDAQLVADAFERGTLEVRRASGERWALHVDVERNGARVGMRFEQASPEWDAFERALAATFGECRVELADGDLLAEPLGRHWPCALSKAKDGALAFALEKPGVTLAQLDKASLRVVSGPGVERMPSKLRVVSLDRKVQLDAQLSLEWKAEGEAPARRMCSTPQPLYATIVDAL